MRRFLPCLFAAAILPLAAAAHPAAAAASCTTQQLTSVGTGFAMSGAVVSGDGNRVAFVSSYDLTGGNADHSNEIFVYDVAEEEVHQITTGLAAVDTAFPSLTHDGHVVAYVSNLDGNYEVFRWIDGGLLDVTQQVTTTTAGYSGRTSISGDGDEIAFETSSPIGGPNTDGNIEIALYDVSATAFTRITDTAEGDNVQPDLSATGNRLVFASNANPTGAGGSDGNTEVYAYDPGAGVLRQVTHTAAASVDSPTINADGTRIAFRSTAGHGAPNPENRPDLFVADTRAGTVSAMTFSATMADGYLYPALDGTGRRLAYVGNFVARTRDLGGAVRDGRVHPTAALGDSLDIDRAGTHIATIAEENPTGANADGSDEVFLSTCTAPPAAPRCHGLYASVRLGRGDQPTSGNDVIVGTPGNDTVSAKTGRDHFCGLGGNDGFRGGPGNDNASGGSGNDRLRGDAGNDRLAGDAGNDVLRGGAGPDTCLGGPGVDDAATCTTRIGVP